MGLDTITRVLISRQSRQTLLCVCDMMRDRADEAGARYDCKVYYEVADMLREERLDAVSVATGGFENGAAHYEPTIKCLDAGLHVLCEKPISNNIEHAREMVRRAREQKRYLGINLNHRFVPPAAQAKEWIERGDLGDLLFVNMALWINNPNEFLRMVPPPGAAPPLRRRDALLLRRSEASPGVPEPARRAKVLVERQHQHGIRQRRGRASDRQL